MRVVVCVGRRASAYWSADTRHHGGHMSSSTKRKKEYILDTNVLIHDAQALFKFRDNDVILDISAIEELDTFKKDSNGKGRNARETSRILDSFRKHSSLHNGVKLPSGGMLYVKFSSAEDLRELPPAIDKTKNDNAILALAKCRHRDAVDKTVILVTMDINLRLKADAIGIVAQDYESGKVRFDEFYTGAAESIVPMESMSAVFKSTNGFQVDSGTYFPNQFVNLRCDSNLSQSALCRYDAATSTLRVLKKLSASGVWGAFPRNREQAYALDLLLDDSIPLVTLVGKAGTGKTLLAIAAGLQKVAEDHAFSKLLVSRPVFPMGRDLGFIPGDINEKLNPWMTPIYDNIEHLLHGYSGKDLKSPGRMSKPHQELVSMGILEVEPLTYIRGRSIPNQFLIVDEAQNLTPHEIKTIITRAGEGTKIVLTGDPYQIDNPYLDTCSNGLSYVVEKMKNQPLSGHVTLTRGERSELAEVASNLL